MNRNFRVALCFSGQLREWESAFPSIKKFINFFDTKPDIFCHMWDFNSTSHAIKFHTNENIIHDLKQGEVEKALSTFNPTRHLVENIEKSKLIEERSYNYIKLINKLQENEEIPHSPYWLSSQYYGISQASILKQEHELENNFTYDLVIRMRYDSYFTNAFIEMFSRESISYIKPFTIYSTHSNLSDKYPFLEIGDIFFMADSLTYNIISDYVNHLPHVFQCMNNKPAKPEELFAFYIKSNFLRTFPLEGDVKVKRPLEYGHKLDNVGVSPYDCDFIPENIL